MAKYASIDIGTNTLRLLIAEAGKDGELKPLVYERVITRLGGGFSGKDGIDRASAERTFRALEKFKKLIDGYGAAKKSAVATSVVRRAKNRDWFLKEISERTGLTVSVISGKKEAELSFLGVLSVIGALQKKDKLVMDIGGGSTEFILTGGMDIRGVWSMEMGVVHLAENHLKGDPPEKHELEGLGREIKGVIEDLKKSMKEKGISVEKYSEKANAEIIGTAGTITTLAAIDQDLAEYDRDKINNYILKKSRIEGIYNRLVSCTLMEREKILSLEKGREDLIIPGALIVLNVMGSFGFDSMRVADAGLLEGAIINELCLAAEKHKKRGGNL